MANLLIPPQLTFTDADGAPLAGGKLYTYVPGTLTHKPTFQDAAETISNTNPIILDARGAAVVFGDGDYRMILTDSSDNQIFDLAATEPLPASAISAVMLPVVGALTLQQARDLMGVSGAIQTAVSNVQQQVGPQGVQGVPGIQGPAGPPGPAGGGGVTFTTNANGSALQFNAGGLIQWGSGTTGTNGNATITFPVAFTVMPSFNMSGTGPNWISEITYGFLTTTSVVVYGRADVGGGPPVAGWQFTWSAFGN